MPNFDVGKLRELPGRGATGKIRIAIEHRAGKMQIHDAVGLAVLVLQTSDKAIFRSKYALALAKFGKCQWVINLLDVSGCCP